MVKIIVAFAKDEQCIRVASALESVGLAVFRRCTSAGEVKQAFNQCGDGILIASCRLPDSTIDALAWDLGDRAVVLAVGSPAQLELGEHPGIFKLAFPCSRGELTSAVSMLLQLYRMRLSAARSAEEKQTIEKAKERLCRLKGMTEPQAHRFLQKSAMDRGMKLSEFAAKILDMGEL